MLYSSAALLLPTQWSVCCIDRLDSPAKAVVRNWLLLTDSRHGQRPLSTQSGHGPGRPFDGLVATAASIGRLWVHSPRHLLDDLREPANAARICAASTPGFPPCLSNDNLSFCSILSERLR